MGELTDIATRLRQQYPTLDVTGSSRELVVRRGRTSVRLRAGKEVGDFDARERATKRKEGASYLDLGSGALYIDEGSLFLHVTLPRSGTRRLSPYQCALLSAILDRNRGEWFAAAMGGPQVDLIRLVKVELGVDVPPMAMSRFLAALRGKGIVRGDELAGRSALGSLREDFRLSGVGRAEGYAGDYRVVEESLERQLDGRFARGVADALLTETGAWIEPRDYLVDRSALSGIRESLGSPVPRGYQGAVVLVRPAMRVPLGLLTLGRRSIQPLLGLAESVRSESPVARQASLEAWNERAEEWR